MASPLLLSLACLFLAFGVWFYNEALLPTSRKFFGPASRKKWRLPPGPPGYPVVGNLVQMARCLDKAGDGGRAAMMGMAQYGEMTTLHLGARTWILLNTRRVCEELISKRGNITAERANMPVSNEIVSQNLKSVLQKTEDWKEPRRLMHHLLSGTALTQYGAWQEQESIQMLAEYMYYPKQWYEHNYRYANSVVHRIALGERIAASSKDLADLQRLVAIFTGSVGSSIMDWFPELVAMIPKSLQPWRPFWLKIGKWHSDVYHKWWDPVVEQYNAGKAPPSWARDVLLNPESKWQGDAEATCYAGMELIEAGSDTTRQTLNVFIMAVLKHPEVLTKVRAEVDAVCGTEEGSMRLPVMNDMDSMPYCSAAAKEIIRWRPVLPIVPEHTSTKDIEFEGYLFPAGTGFVINNYAANNDCEDYERFMPERYLDGNEQNPLHGVWGFGGGRRVCVGYRLASRGLFLNIARLAMCFDFEEREPIKDSRHMNQETTKEPFPANIKLRAEKYRKLIEDAAQAEGVLEAAKKPREVFPEYEYVRPSLF